MIWRMIKRVALGAVILILFGLGVALGEYIFELPYVRSVFGWTFAGAILLGICYVIGCVVGPKQEFIADKYDYEYHDL